MAGQRRAKKSGRGPAAAGGGGRKGNNNGGEFFFLSLFLGRRGHMGEKQIEGDNEEKKIRWRRKKKRK